MATLKNLPYSFENIELYCQTVELYHRILCWFQVLKGKRIMIFAIVMTY